MQVLAHCDILFEHELSAVRTLLPLPWKVLDYEGAPIDELRGFRAVKLAGEEEIRFSAIVDMSGKDKLLTSVSFDEVGILDDNFVKAAFARGVEYAGRLVRPKEGG